MKSHRLSPAAQLFAQPHVHGALTRRQFLQAGAALATLGAGTGLIAPQSALAAPALLPAAPRPIPYGTQFLYPDPTIFHVQAPGYPLPNPPFDTNPAINNPATITDFNGVVGLGYVGGQGTHIDLTTHQTSSVYWEVDMRFMIGDYIAVDGRQYHATFGFV